MARIIRCSEERIYYCKWGQIPFKSRVWLYAKIYFPNGYRMGAFEWNGRKFACPLRILRRVKHEEGRVVEISRLY